MKIVMVSEHASPLTPPGGREDGGQNVHVAGLARALVAQGHDVTVYTRRTSPDFPDRVTDESGYVVEHVPAGPAAPIAKDQLLPHLPEFANYLGERWGQRRPDVVHAHYWMSGMVALAAAKHVGVPVVQTFHSLGVLKRRHQRTDDTGPPGRIPMERVIASSVAHTIATASDELLELVRMGVPRRRATVVPCGVDVDHFRPGGITPPEDRPRVVSVGRLVEHKGFDLLIRALRRVPEVELWIGGGGDESELAGDPEAIRLRGLAERLGVADRVRLLGRIPRADLPELLRSARVVASTPWYEPFGLVPLEAMSCGVPVLASAVGGHVDTIVDGVTGVLVQARRPDLLAVALNRLLEDPVQRDAYGVAGADRARSRYSWDRIAADTTRVYEEVLGEPSGPPPSEVAELLR